MTEYIILVGGGGHCRSVIDVVEAEGRYHIAGIVDRERSGDLLGYPILGDDGALSVLINTYQNALVTVGQIKDSKTRFSIYQNLQTLGAKLPVVVSPLAHVSRHAQVGSGTVIMHGAIVNAGARIGANCIVNTHAVIEHDVTIGDHCHLSTGCLVNGEVVVGQHCFIGSNAVLNQCVTITSQAIIGAGSVVIKNVDTAGVYVGNPAQKI